MRKAFIIMVCLIAACKNPPANNAASNQNVVSKKAEVKEMADYTKDSLINIQFSPGDTSTSVRGKLKGINAPVTVYIPVITGTNLSVAIVPEDSVANIRINQIFSPDGKADGPFGKELKRTINQKGTYKLIIGEDLMQGDEWKGTFILTVAVK